MSNGIRGALAVAILAALASTPGFANDREMNPLLTRHLYVAEVNGHGNVPGQIAVFSLAARGNAAPEYLLGGTKTGIWAPRDMTWDARGNLYVIDEGSHSQAGNGRCARLLVFRPNAKGDAPPERRIEGKETAFCDGAGGVAVDHAGNVYISAFHDGYVCVFSPYESGNVKPVRTLSIDSGKPSYLAFERTGKLLVGVTNNILEYYSDGELAGQMQELGFLTAFAVGNDLIYAPTIESNVFTVINQSDHTTRYAFPYPKHAFWSASADGNGTTYILYDPPPHAQLPPEVLVYAPGAKKPSRSIGGSRTTLTNYGVARVGP